MSYTHMFELTEESRKQMCATVMNAVDASTLLVLGLSVILIVRDVVAIVEFVTVAQVWCMVLYLLLIPESPKWLMMNGKITEGISVMNYIAKFNGAKERIPNNAEFDFIGQALNQNQTINRTNIGILKAIESQQVLELTR